MITEFPICNIKPGFSSNSVSESPSLQLELERELADLNFERRKQRSYRKYDTENPIYHEDDQSEDGDDIDEEESRFHKTISYFEVKVLIGGLYDQIAVGITNNKDYPLNEFAGYKNNSIAFHADDGKCYVNG